MVRLAGSLTTGQVRAYDLIKMMTAGGRLTGLGAAFAALRTAEAQQLQELVEDDPVADPQAMAAERMVRVVRRPIRQQSCELVPERFGQP
jgi:hypothetical protein